MRARTRQLFDCQFNGKPDLGACAHVTYTGAAKSFEFMEPTDSEPLASWTFTDYIGSQPNTSAWGGLTHYEDVLRIPQGWAAGSLPCCKLGWEVYSCVSALNAGQLPSCFWLTLKSSRLSWGTCEIAPTWSVTWVSTNMDASHKTQPPTESGFEGWQLADDLANSAEQICRNEFTVQADGKGHTPSEIQVEVSIALRKDGQGETQVRIERLREAIASVARGPQ